jgi:hypothetical protein
MELVDKETRKYVKQVCTVTWRIFCQDFQSQEGWKERLGMLQEHAARAVECLFSVRNTVHWRPRWKKTVDAEFVDILNSVAAHPQYRASVVDPLQKDEGVTCFVIDAGNGTQTVLYGSHRLTGELEFYAKDPRRHVRAAYAIIVQIDARQKAAQAGERALVK